VHNRTIGNPAVRPDPSAHTSEVDESGWPLSELDAGRAIHSRSVEDLQLETRVMRSPRLEVELQLPAPLALGRSVGDVTSIASSLTS
jgi:hypothetical protein